MSQKLFKMPDQRIAQIHSYFMESQEQLCAVESCTGGLLSFWLSSSPGASSYFKGGLVSYQKEIKKWELGLSEQMMETQGLVTASFAKNMAQSIKKKWSCDWAVSVTGIAGPSLGDLGENIGKIAFSVCSPSAEKSIVKQLYGTGRQNFQYKASLFALDFLISGFK